MTGAAVVDSVGSAEGGELMFWLAALALSTSAALLLFSLSI
jgi:hypothetical protein